MESESNKYLIKLKMEILSFKYLEPQSFLFWSELQPSFNLKNRIFNLKLTKLGVEFQPHIPDPTTILMGKILGQPIKIGVRVLHLSSGIYLVYPYGPVPFHYMLFLRDLIQRKYPTWSGSAIKVGWSNRILKVWNTLLPGKQKEYLTTWYNDHFRSYRFQVNNDKWSSHNGMSLDERDNVAAHFAKQSSKYHILMGGVRGLYACEGGFSSSSKCPTLCYEVCYLLEKVGLPRIRYPDFSFIRGGREYWTKWNAPYWKLLYLRQCIEDFGVKTSDWGHY